MNPPTLLGIQPQAAPGQNLLLGTIVSLGVAAMNVMVDGATVATRAVCGLAEGNYARVGSRVLCTRIGSALYVTQVLTGVANKVFNYTTTTVASVANATFQIVGNWLPAPSPPDDYFSSYNALGGQWTFGQEGIYEINFQQSWAVGAQSRRISAIFINSAEVARGDWGNGGASNATSAATWTGNVAAGDTINFQVWQNTGGALNTVAAATQCNFYRLGTTLGPWS